ncbi:hypothetical protein B0H14DRAFT_3904737 [Mycena olivaceomarginata]|nr:hypothetical protein B0H14DRAFT_3904737 [Mycena olivaceomarginata]
MSSLLPPRTLHRLCRPQLDAESMSRSPRATSHMRSNPGSPSPSRKNSVFAFSRTMALPARRVPPPTCAPAAAPAFVASPGTATIFRCPSFTHCRPPGRILSMLYTTGVPLLASSPALSLSSSASSRLPPTTLSPPAAQHEPTSLRKFPTALVPSLSLGRARRSLAPLRYTRTNLAPKDTAPITALSRSFVPSVQCEWSLTEHAHPSAPMPRNASLGSSDLNTTNYDVATSCHLNQNDLGKPQLVRMRAQGHAFRFACGFSVPMIGDTAVPFIQLGRGIWRSLFSWVLTLAHSSVLDFSLLRYVSPRQKSPSPSPPWPPTTPNRRAPT